MDRAILARPVYVRIGMRNEGLITGWKILGVFSKRMETIVVRVLSDFWFLPSR